ncbi:MAG: outer membrane beta-barrel protein [Candidatus Thiodiazotropha sp.]|jgi:OOP family OmpA-OmpF porin
MKYYGSAALLGMLFLSPAAFAQNGYLGFGMGLANYSDRNSDGYLDYSFNDSDTGINIYGGQKINEYFALEMSYTHFGKQEGSFSFYDTTYDTNVEVFGFGVSVVGFYPVSDNLNLFLKIGTFDWDVNVNIDSVSGRGNDSELLLGFGGEFRFTKKFSLRTAWEMVDIEGADLDILSVNAQFNF